MFYNAEQTQQLKVFAKSGEFINFGASHVGITEGFIQVYTPDGKLYAVYDNTGATEGFAIINKTLKSSMALRVVVRLMATGTNQE